MIRRDWRKYSKEILLVELGLVAWSTDKNNVQNCWDDFESKIVKIINKIVTLSEFKNDRAKITTPSATKNKLNEKETGFKMHAKTTLMMI